MPPLILSDGRRTDLTRVHGSSPTPAQCVAEPSLLHPYPAIEWGFCTQLIAVLLISS